MRVNSGNEFGTEGLDFHALIFTLWRQKIIVLCFALFGVACAALYTFIAQPIYEAKSFVIPPAQSDIQNLNYGRGGFTPLTVGDIYSIFLKKLQAESLRREFFKTIYLPALGRSDDPKGKLYEKLTKSLTIAPVGKDVNDRYMVSFQDPDAERAGQWVDQYLSMAHKSSLDEINKNLSTEFDVISKNYLQEIHSLREVGDKTREDALVKLQEALTVAKAIGLEKPPIISGNSNQSLNIAGSIAGNMGGELTYMRGTKALEAEIENMRERKSDDPFIQKLRAAEANFSFYKAMSQRVQQINTFRTDGAVSVSDEPVKPKGMLLVIAGLVLGLMIGIVAALFRNSLVMLRKD